jgi:hypothetical protein
MLLLRRLDLSSNRLGQLPTSLSSLGRLEWLDAARNLLVHLRPCILGGLTKLVMLSVGFNRLSMLPCSMARMQRLRYLHAAGNTMHSLPAGVCRLPRLVGLNMCNNGLTFLPSSISRVTGLLALDVSSNRLSSLPDGLTKLLGLEGIDLQNNQLQRLPRGVGALRRLYTLRMEGNPLVALPDSITRLTHLSYLTYDPQGIAVLPEGLTALHVRHPGTYIPDTWAQVWPKTVIEDFPVSVNHSLPPSARELAALAAAAAQLEQQLDVQGQGGEAAVAGGPPTPSPLDTLLEQLAAGQGDVYQQYASITALAAHLEVSGGPSQNTRALQVSHRHTE